LYCALPIVIWALIILAFSSQTYQEQTIIPFLIERIDAITLSDKLPDITLRYGDKVVHSKHQPYHFVEFVFRKAAHFVIYMGAAFLAAIALIPYKISRMRKLLFIFAICLALSVLDETIQSMTITRTPFIADILVDLGGAIFGLMLAWPLLGRELKR